MRHRVKESAQYHKTLAGKETKMQTWAVWPQNSAFSASLFCFLWPWLTCFLWASPYFWNQQGWPSSSLGSLTDLSLCNLTKMTGFPLTFALRSPLEWHEYVHKVSDDRLSRAETARPEIMCLMVLEVTSAVRAWGTVPAENSCGVQRQQAQQT